MLWPKPRDLVLHVPSWALHPPSPRASPPLFRPTSAHALSPPPCHYHHTCHHVHVHVHVHVQAQINSALGSGEQFQNALWRAEAFAGHKVQIWLGHDRTEGLELAVTCAYFRPS